MRQRLHDGVNILSCREVLPLSLHTHFFSPLGLATCYQRAASSTPAGSAPQRSSTLTEALRSMLHHSHGFGSNCAMQSRKRRRLEWICVRKQVRFQSMPAMIARKQRLSACLEDSGRVVLCYILAVSSLDELLACKYPIAYQNFCQLMHSGLVESLPENSVLQSPEYSYHKEHWYARVCE